ncbi:MAG: ABC transporter substrate-binding protein [Oscillospiraceae bacterium]|nr:ABC transporter substrate-binding protein [Oscillospiraceae bacterium]
MRKRLFALSLALALVAAVFAACGNDGGGTAAQGTPAAGDGGETAASDAPVRIAVAAPMTGDLAQYGLGFWQAAQLQVDSWNDAGGVLGRRVEVLQFDDMGSLEEGASIAERIAADPTIIGVIGHFASGVAMTAAPTYNENQIINISPSASHPDFSPIGEFIFRNNTVINVEAAAGLDIAVELGYTQIGILSIMTDWGESTSQIVSALIEEHPSLTLVGHEEILEGTVDYSPAITALHAAGAQVIICVSMYNTLAPFAVQYSAVNPDIQIIGFSNAYTHNLIALGGDAVEGVRFPVSFFAASPAAHVQDFVERYVERFGESPSALTAQAYDSTGMILQAIVEAGGTDDRMAIRDALENIAYYGVTGEPPTRFTEGGDVIREFTKVMIQNGEFVLAQ